ncbi:MAG: hypothetical protein AAFX93_07175 [Verrucomicrobiota bacterium]
MIIYGSRMYGRSNEVRSKGRCEHCGVHGNLHSYDGRKWGHLYFIPLVPSGGKVRVLRECKSCNVGSHIPIETIPTIAESMRENLDQAIIAAGAQQTHFEAEGQSVSTIAVIGSNIEDMYCMLGEEETVQILDSLRSVGQGPELILAEAKYAETKGHRDAAHQKYTELSQLTKDPIAQFHHASFLFDHGMVEEAIAVAEPLEMEHVEDLGLKDFLIKCYTATKQWTKLADTYENCFLIVPESLQDKKIYKDYKKACKKAGRTPQKK